MYTTVRDNYDFLNCLFSYLKKKKMSNDLLSTDDCLKILKQKHKTDVSLHTMDLSPLSENKEGYMGQHFILNVTYKSNSSDQELSDSFFVKTKPKSSQAKKVVDNLQLYKKESFFYNFLIKEFEKSGYDVGFAPKMYLCKNQETIVLEDLRRKEYVFSDELFSGEEEIKAALRGLAVFHANCVSYEERRSKKLGRPYSLVEENKEVLRESVFLEENSFVKNFLQSSVDSLLVILKLIPQSKEWKQILAHKLLNFNPERFIQKDFGFKKTVTHSDLWRNNILFKGEACALVDFQLIRYYYPAFDVLLLIFLLTRRELREAIYASAIELYYSTFIEVLKNNGCSEELFPEGDFLRSLDAVRPLAFFNAVCYRTLRFMPKCDASSDGSTVEDAFFKKDTKVKVVEGLYRDNELAREVMVEDLYDMYDIL